MTGALKIGIVGCLGRMGRVITESVLETAGARFVAGCEIPSHAAIGQLIGDTGVILQGSAGPVFANSDVVIDFTPPGNTAAHAALATSKGAAYVVGTTGLTDADQAALDAAGNSVPVVQAGNFSLGVNMLMALVRDAAFRLGQDWDIEVVEMHHRHKVDAPSGTALMLGEAAAEGRGVALADVRTPAREGLTGERKAGTIGFSAIRGGAVIGEHDVIFASGSERLVLSHKAENRRLFADGAVRAALWTAGQKPGRYSMTDVLGL